MAIPDKQFIALIDQLARGECPVKTGYRATESQHLIMRRLCFGVLTDSEMCMRHPELSGNISRVKHEAFLKWVKEVMPTMKQAASPKKNLRERLRRSGG